LRVFEKKSQRILKTPPIGVGRITAQIAKITAQTQKKRKHCPYHKSFLQ